MMIKNNTFGFSGSPNETWNDIPKDLLRSDWKRIADYYQAYYHASGRLIYNLDGTLTQHKQHSFPNGIPNWLLNKSPRKKMIISDGDTQYPASKLLKAN